MNKKILGTKDSRDLSNDAQFYYEKLITFLNDFAYCDNECERAIGYLDDLIDEIRKEK